MSGFTHQATIFALWILTTYYLFRALNATEPSIEEEATNTPAVGSSASQAARTAAAQIAHAAYAIRRRAARPHFN